jgi:diguanylate cyclase (GGDEF)-like protein/PAS domain S-box-containing protein
MTEFDAFASVIADVCDAPIAGIRIGAGDESQLVASTGEGYDLATLRALFAAPGDVSEFGFYAIDEPITDRSGDAVGAMRVIDVMPQTPSSARSEALRVLGAAIVETVEGGRERPDTDGLSSIGRVVEFVADPIGIFEIGEPGTLPVFAYVNRAFTELFGYTSADVIGRTPRLLRGPESENAVLADVRKALDANEPAEATVTYYTATRERRVVQLRDRPLGPNRRIVSFRDFTAERAAEGALGELHQRLQSLVDGNNDAVFTLDRTGACIAANAAAEALTGRSSADLCAGGLLQFAGGTLFPSREAFPERLLAGESFAFNALCTDASGRDHDVACRAIPMVVADETHGAFLLVTDLTERRRLASLATRQANRARALSQIAAATESSGADFVDAVLDLTMKSFGMQNAFVGEIHGPFMNIVNVVGEIVYPIGTTLEVEHTNIRHMLAVGDVFATEDMHIGPWRGLLCAPLTVRGRAYGAIGFASRNKGVYDEADRDFIRLVASLVASAIERRGQVLELDRLAYVDGLTDLPNRTHLLRELTRAIDAREPFAMHFVDLDGFKLLNDFAGHGVGDLALHEAAARLQSRCGPHDTPARLGGDEFVILQMHTTERAGASAFAAQILEALAIPYDIDGQTFALGASIGTALFPADGIDADTLLRRADTALYRAKTSGKGRAEMWRPPDGASPDDGSRDRSAIERRRIRS